MDRRITCLACASPIDDDAPTYPDESGTLCATCAPTYDLLIDEDLDCYFVDQDGAPLTSSVRRELYDAHIAAGGKPTDSMARR
jgi:hypothetical protein